MNTKIQEKLKLLPDKPGVYKMFNAQGELIYVGKAVNLKNRVRQYFQSQKNHTAKVRAMVSNICDFDFVIVTNETEALNLESNLIKQNMPYYNILLKDDKHFPYIRIDFRQDFPRVEIVRRYKRDGAKYFGPYLSSFMLRETIEAVRENFPVRQCKHDIGRMIARGERPCLMYHVGKCCAPCTGKVTREQYHELLNEVAALFEGNCKPYIAKLTEQMQKESQNLNFEKAAQLRDRIRAIKSVSEKQIASSATDKCYDVFALARDELGTLAYGLFVRGGNVISAEGYKIEAEDESFSEIIEQFLLQFYHDAGDMPHEINVADEPQECEQLEAFLSQKCGHSVKIRVPKRGEKLKQCELAKMNAAQTLARSRELAHREWEAPRGHWPSFAALSASVCCRIAWSALTTPIFRAGTPLAQWLYSSTENRKKACTAALKQSRTRPGTIILPCVNTFRDGSNERLRVTKSLPSCRICWLWTAAGDSSMLRLRFWTNTDCHTFPQ